MIAIVSHDAGGAEILSSWIRQNPQPCCLALGGPAISIFQRKLGDFENIPLADAIERCDWVLCGTSWQSDLERQAIALARIATKKVIAFLDHWVNYPERFKLDGETLLPNEIWVGDVDAKNIARKIFPYVKVILTANPYLEDLQFELKALQKSSNYSKQCSVLYLCEPIREHALLAYGDERYWGYTEEDAIQFFLENIDALGGNVNRIQIRPHPSEIKNKYDWVKKENSLVDELDSTKSLIEQIVEADIVVGCESMAMVVALMAKKRVISSIPPGGRECSLPQDGVEYLHVLVTNYLEALDV